MDGLLSLAAQFCSVAFFAAISSLPLFLLVGVITYVGQRRLSARVRFALWTLVLIRMILPVSLETPFGLGMLTNHWSEPDPVPSSASERLSVDVSLTPQIASSVSDPGTANSTPRLAMARYLAMWTVALGLPGISLLFAAWILVTSRRLASQVRRGTIPANPKWNELLELGRRTFGIRVPVQLRVLAGWRSPAVFGYFRPVILLPEDAASLTDAESQHVLWHELAHIKRGDVGWNVLWIAARCLQWWNPSFWWTQRAWLVERELACDALVMQHLGSSSAADYGRTLIRFLERLAESPYSLQAIPLPRLVLFLGHKHAFRRRLQQLAHPIVIESFWGRWCSFGLLVILAVMGLTDAAASKVESTPRNSVTVPSGTVWQFGPDVVSPKPPEDQPLTTVVYDVSAVLTRLHQDEPLATPELEAESLRDFIQQYAGIFPRTAGRQPTDCCSIEGQRLIVRADKSQHETLQNLLSHWTQFGRRQICLEVQFVTTDRELSEFLPMSGGQIVSPSPLHEMDLLQTSQWSAEVNHSSSSPSFVRKLTAGEMDHVSRRLQGDPKKSHEFAPKVTMFSGSWATVNSYVQRPFVTGLRTKDDGGYEPQISMVPEGVWLKLGTTLKDVAQNIDLSFQIRLCEILNVEVLKTKMSEKEANIQIPHVREMNLKSSLTLANGESLLVSPLRRDKQGRLQVYLMTATLIEDQ